MSLSGGTAYVDVALGKTDDLTRGITTAGENAADTAKSSFLSRVGSIAMGGALANALTSGVSQAFQFGKGAVFDFNSQLQQADIGFTTMLGSSQKAGAFLTQLQNFAKTTPFEFGNLVQNAQQMMGMGIAAKDVIPDLTALGDSVASIGGSASQVDSVTLAFDQMAAKGTLDMGNMNQLMQGGVPNALKIMADHYKVTTGQMIEMISTGKVQANEALPALIGGLEHGTKSTAALGGMMDKQSKTMAGALSNIKDSATQSLAGAFKPVFDAASGAAQHLADVLGSGAVTSASKKISDGLTSVFGRAGQVLKDFQTGWDEHDTALGKANGLQVFAGHAADSLYKVEDVFDGFRHAADYTGESVGKFTAIGVRIRESIDQYKPQILELFDRIKSAVGEVAPILKTLFLDRIATIKEIVGDAIPIVQNLARELGPVLGEIFRSAGDLIVNHLLPAFLKISTFIQQQVIPAVMDFVSFAVQHLVPVFVDIAKVVTEKVVPIVEHLVDLFVAKVLPALGPLIKDGFGLLKDVIAKLTPIVQDLVHWFADYVLPVLAKLAEFLIGTLIPFVLQVADVLIKILRPAFDFVVVIVRDVVIPIFKFIAGMFLAQIDIAAKMAAGVIKAVQDVAGIFTWCKTEIGKVFAWIGQQWDSMVSTFAGIPGRLAAAGGKMWDWIKDSFKSAINTVIGWWNGLSFSLPKVHIPGTNADVGGGTIGVPQIPKLAGGGLVLPTPGGTVVQVAEAGEAEIVAPQRILEAAFANVMARHGRIGRDSPLIGTVNMPGGISADEVAERLYFNATARGVSI